MAELNLPSHRWHQKQNHVRLALEDFSRQYIYDSGLRRIDGHIMKKDGYAIGADSPNFLADFKAERYYADTIQADFLGAITHTRNGNATMTDSSGNIVWAPHNLLTYSEQFDNAAWGVDNSGASDPVVTANHGVAPNGSQTADRIQFDKTGGTFSRIQQLKTGLASARYTFTVWLKNNGSGTANVGIRINADGVNCEVTESWQSFTVSLASAGTSASPQILLFDSIVGNDETADVLAWGAHLYRSDLGGMADVPADERVIPSATKYVRTTSSARYLPRRGHHVYNGSQWVNKGLLVESEARTNLVTYSDIIDADWGTAASGVGISITDLALSSGGVSFSKVTALSGTSFHHCARTFSVSASVLPYTLSVFVKDDTAGFASLTISGGAPSLNASYVFDLSDGSVAQTLSAGDALPLVENMGNGILKISITDTTNGTSGNPQFKVGPHNGSSSETWATSGGESIYVAAAQAEQGSTPSSYIPTSGATVTRAAETLTVPAANLPWPTPQYVTGEELVTNGDFSDGLTGWTQNANATGTANVVGGQLVQTAPHGDYSETKQLSGSTVGKVYLCSFEVTAKVDSTTVVVLQFGRTILYSGTIANIPIGVFSGVVTSSHPDGFSISVRTDGEITIDNISVKEINPLSVSIQMKGEMTYADEGASPQIYFYRRYKDANNLIYSGLQTNGARTGRALFAQFASGVPDFVGSSDTTYTPSISVPFNIASRHGSTFINGAVDGVALTEETTPVALPDLSSTDLELGYDFMGTISLFRMWADDLGDTGIEGATEPSEEATLFLSFDGFDHTSYINFDWSE